LYEGTQTTLKAVSVRLCVIVNKPTLHSRLEVAILWIIILKRYVCFQDFSSCIFETLRILQTMYSQEWKEAVRVNEVTSPLFL